MNKVLRKSPAMACLVVLTLAFGMASTTTAQDWQYADAANQGFNNYQRGGQEPVSTFDADAFKQRAQQSIQRQLAANGYYSTQGIGDWINKGKDGLVDLIDKIVPEKIKPFIPELPNLDKFGKKPKLMEMLTPAQRNFLRDGARVYSNLYNASRADAANLKAAIERKDGKAAAKLLGKLAYRHNPLMSRLRAARALGMRSVTISVSGGGSYFIGADGTHGIAIEIDSILNPDNGIRASWYATVAVSGGAQAGASVSLNLGFTPAMPRDLGGLSYEGRLSGTFAAGVGVSIGYDPVNNKFLGGAFSINTGAEAEASFAMGHTEVIKTFNVGFSGGNTDPVVDPGTNPGTNPDRPRKSLGIYSTLVQDARYRRNGERVDSVAANTAAARAGLEVGDVILSANNQPIQTGESLRQAIATSGNEMSLQVVNVRNGQIVTVTVRF